MKPLWREGLYVMPQHFQAFEEHLEEALDRRVRTMAPHGFGVSELEIDSEALVRGVFQVKKLVAIMPDGMRVEIGPDHPVKEAVVMMDGAVTGGGRKAEVYIGVPSNASRGSAGYAGDAGASGARWARSEVMYKDAYGTADDAQIEFVRPNAQFLLGTSDRRSYVTIKLAELELSENGVLTVSDKYVPPILATEASHAVTARLTRLVSSLGAKQDALASRYRGRSAAVVEFGAVDMVTFWFLHTLNTTLPTMMHYARLGRVHPERLYLDLAKLAGALFTFDPKREVKEAPPYQHLDLAATLFPLFDQVQELLATVVGQQYKSIQLEEVQAGLFVARKIDRDLLAKSQLFLIASGDVPEKALREELPTFVRISSTKQITNVVQAAIPGLDVAIDHSPPTAIPVRPENVYLKLGQSGAHWKDILRTSSIAVFQPVQAKAITLELVAVEL